MEIDEYGYGICSVCKRRQLIKYKTKYGRLICVYCAERPSDPIMERLNKVEFLEVK